MQDSSRVPVLRMPYALNTEILTGVLSRGKSKVGRLSRYRPLTMCRVAPPMQNTARNIGKLAPTGVVSAGLGSGVPFMIGNAIGGPAVGAASAASTMGAGFAGRELATRMGLRNADVAELLARSGGTLPNASNPAIRDAVIQALIGSQLAAQSNIGGN
ncbi:structural protein [Brucella phage EF4]|uniref:Structural protein n=1 Tax=Brucella phage EF4 TaxID=2706778 RepID=A0A6C0X1W8_9CAUD|nr:structural protein [Brucella phage EF4]